MKQIKIKYTKNVLFLKPFVERMKDVLPLKKVKYIRGYKVNKNLTSKSNASIIKTNGKYSINLEVAYYDKKSKKYISKTLENILISLAHELAHLIHWDHSAAHFRQQSGIAYEFAYVLQELNMNNHSKRINGIN